MDGSKTVKSKRILVNELKTWYGIVQDGDIDAFRSFVEDGGDYRAKHYGRTPFFLSCIEAHLELAMYISSLPNVDFLEKCDDVNAFYVACQSGNLDLVKFLLSLNVYDKNLRQIGGCTALYCACQGTHLDVVKLLLDAGADVDIPDEDGNSNLLSAVATGKMELFTLLLEYGAHVTEEALEFAKIGGRSQMRKILEQRLGMKIPRGSGLVKICCQCRTNAAKMLMCSRCNNATYCSKACQTQAWASHRPH